MEQGYGPSDVPQPARPGAQPDVSGHDNRGPAMVGRDKAVSQNTGNRNYAECTHLGQRAANAAHKYTHITNAQ